MSIKHNQMATIAIISTLIFGTLFVGISGFFQTNESIGGFESAVEEDLRGEADLMAEAIDTDGDGLSDKLEETQYGTDVNDADTDNDGMSDGWEVQHGLNPLDNGESDDINTDPTQSEETEDATIANETDSWPDPNQGPTGDPDRDGLTNQAEQELGTDPQRADTDNDGLNDRWESLYTMAVQTPGGEVTLFNPLDGNWDCLLLDQAMVDALETRFNGENGIADWDDLASNDRHSCDMVLDTDDDGLANFEEEAFGTNPTARDSDMDLIDDIVEISNESIGLFTGMGENCNEALLDPEPRIGPFFGVERSWFMMDMDGDGLLNGPSDWDTDGDGMPDGFEYCYSIEELAPNAAQVLNPSNASDGYGDWDEDGMNNLEEYQVAQIFGEGNFTSPWLKDTDQDDMPDQWEAANGLHPRSAVNRNQDPDRDGWDADNDGQVMFSALENSAVVHAIDVVLDEQVEANETVARARITLGGGNQQIVNLLAPVDGYVYGIHVAVGDTVDSRLFSWISIVEAEEQFTNVMEYQANDRDQDGVLDGRSTDPLNADTDGDGLIDGIEVMGWEILVVNRGVQPTWVTSDPGLFDTDSDGLSDYAEFSTVCNGGGSNASNPDTDSDGLTDLEEAGNNFMWDGEAYSTSPCMFDTDNDGLEDGEEVVAGEDNFLTHANNSDTDDDGLVDGQEVLFVPRPFQNPTNPLLNDTDADGMLDGWEMQVKSTEDNTNSHSLWVATSTWLRPGCDTSSQSNSCTMQPGGYEWQNWLGGFALEPKFAVSEMNLTGFLMPGNSLCDGCNGRWALDPSLDSLKDDTFDIDNDTLANGLEGPDRWDTNPVDDDSDGDLLPDGWEVYYSQLAFETGLVDNSTIGAYGARGVMDPSMPDSDLDGIDDGYEDPDNDGLNKTGLIKRYCPGFNDTTNSECNIDPTTPDGQRFYDNLENYTNYEEMQNGTNPITNDTDGDDWNDGPEVYYQDHDDDGMATGWEFHFQFDPFDGADRMVDTDGDGHVNYCEYKWDTNPRNPVSYPGQGELCDPFSD
ncbi:MAG: hypothetical protein ISP83_00200 [Candidatus Poseidonia sp.]|nr:hypothetical protein [Poseidonia sp.]MBL6748504.1 hypothetical protein [Poseidonia sp.]MBL6805908.1 hypothetical protein [Poseidonia sp.]MBL6886920.1 hypothetical protein [Poseidonia sp.]MBL6891988.1 hypothetical protein [Poseidonia sp.]